MNPVTPELIISYSLVLSRLHGEIGCECVTNVVSGNVSKTILLYNSYGDTIKMLLEDAVIKGVG